MVVHEVFCVVIFANPGAANPPTVSPVVSKAVAAFAAIILRLVMDHLLALSASRLV